MAKTKKLLCMALAVAMIASLFCMPASAAVTETAKATFNDGVWPSTMSRTHFASTISSGIYGKDATDYSPQAPTGFTASTDRLFVVNGPVAIPDGGKLKISFDIAGDALTTPVASPYGHYVSMKLNGSSYKYILQSNNVSCDTLVTINSHFNDNAWNNVTVLFEFAEGNATSKYTMYINGDSVYTNSSFNPWASSFATWTSISDFRFGGHMLTNKLYYDNIVVETYEATDSTPSAVFTTASAAKEGNEDLVDATNKTINLTDIEMTVAEFKAATTGFVVLGEDGAVAAEDDYIANSNIYAVYTNDINSYYDKYEVSVEPPVIEGTTAAYKEIVNSEAQEIRLVDHTDLTVGEFLANTTGATVTLLDGSVASDDTLLRNCKVSAVLGSLYNIEYTIVTARSYALENETFDGTYTTRTSSNGTIYSGNGITWSGQTNGKSGITFSEATGLGDKAETDKSLALTVDNADSAGDVFMYLTNPYSLSKTEISSTHTIEGKLFMGDIDANDVDSIDVVLNGRVAIKLMPDGTVKTTDGTALSNATWVNGEWVPFAITLHKATNKINVFVGGIDTGCDWTAAPFQNDIRFRPILKAGASMTFAIDDVKIYTDSLEKCNYTVSDSSVTLTATDNIPCVPILASYDEDGKLVEVKLGKDTRTVSIDYTDGQSVKAMLWDSLSTLKPLVESATVVDQGNLVNARAATLSNAFTDDMVLQSDMPVTVWGTSADANGSTLSVTLGEETKTAYVNGGEWEATFSAREASAEGETLTVATMSGTETVTNIAFGDVYFIGGQSNAYLPMNTVDTYQADKASFTEDDEIRIFHQVGNYAATAQANPVSGSKWEYATESTIGKMSAIGMYFAKTLKENGVDKPIGLISVARSGSSLHWNLPASITDKYTINYMTDKTNQAYNALLAPVEKLAAKGMLWYQGENDSIKGSTDIISQSTVIYDDMFQDFHTYLKETTGNNDFKMFTVQLSSHSNVMDSTNPTTGWQLPWFRSYQYDMVKNMNDVYLIPSQDCGYRTGDDDAAHPDYKKPIGERLAKAALYAIYGTETENNALSPMPDSISYEGSTVTIKFKNVASGLTLMTGDELKGFELIDENGQAVDATATISDKDTVTVTNSSVSEATGVRYAFYRAAANTIANLADSNGLPSPTFTNDKGSDNGSISQKIAVLSEGVMLD